jgi:putative oxidoreductase
MGVGRVQRSVGTRCRRRALGILMLRALNLQTLGRERWMSAHLADAGKLLLRVMVAGLMLFHGVDKLVHGPGEVGGILASYGLPGFLAYGNYVGEIVAPALILAGAWTRLAALAYAFSVGFATLLVHGSDFLHIKPTGAWAAELWVFYIASPLVVALLGPGPYALRRAEFPLD